MKPSEALRVECTLGIGRHFLGRMAKLFGECLRREGLARQAGPCAVALASEAVALGASDLRIDHRALGTRRLSRPHCPHCRQRCAA